MKRLIYLLILALCHVAASAEDAWDPVANSEAVVTNGHARFTVLTPQLIRIQYSSTNQFEDRATFAVVNRKLPIPSFSQRIEGGYLIIETSALTLRYRIGAIINGSQKNSTNLGITFKMNGKNVTWYPGKDDALNLLGTYRTLDGNIGDTHRVFLEKGLVSRAGWAILDESPSAKRGDGSQSLPFEGEVDGIPWVGKPLDNNAIDWYFLGYGHEYKQALGDYIRIAGRQPLPPHYMFGYWYSKYQAYSASEFQQLVKDMETNDVPHDVMMLDCDWHQNAWTGWTWNKSLIPYPTTLLTWMHNHNMKTSLNLHPADGISSSDDNFGKIRAEMGLPSGTTTIPWQLEDPTFYRAFSKNILRVREKEGVDFWWLDWQQDLTSSYVKGLGETFWLNHVFYNDMRINRPDRRPVIFHRWGGMGSHRYPLGFSGDTFATFGTLQFESYYTATAANACFGYWGHDGGGYLQPAEARTDPELVLRWMQFGVFTPIFRTHGSSQSSCERRIWKFDNFNLQNEAFKLRYTLVPYIYTYARQAYDTGVSICRPLYYEWPEENKAYSIEDEYLFGEQILVSPISVPIDDDELSPRTTWLPEGRWYDMCRNTIREGNTTLQDRYALNEIPYFIKAGSIIPCNPSVSHLKTRPKELVLWVIPGGEGDFTLYEDHGDNEAYKEGEYTTTYIRQQRSSRSVTLTVEGRSGQFEGMTESRSIKAVFFSAERPAEVLVDGEATDNWEYDEMMQQLTVSTPTKACSEQTIIEINAVATDINETADTAISISYRNADKSVKVCASADDIAISVVDMQGKEVAYSHLTNAKEAEISMQALPAGQYICRAKAGNSIATRKFIKL